MCTVVFNKKKSGLTHQFVVKRFQKAIINSLIDVSTLTSFLELLERRPSAPWPALEMLADGKKADLSPLSPHAPAIADPGQADLLWTRTMSINYILNTLN